MPEEIYVYSKPKQEYDLKKILAVVLIAVAAIAVVAVIVVSLGNAGGSKAPAVTYDLDGSTYSVADPSGRTGEAGLSYIKTNSQESLSVAQSECTDHFQGSWVDTSSEIGCYYMQDFEDYYCGLSIVYDLAQLCMQIGGSYDCSSSQVFCRV